MNYLESPYKVKTFFLLLFIFVGSLATFWYCSARRNYDANAYNEDGVDVTAPFYQNRAGDHEEHGHGAPAHGDHGKGDGHLDGGTSPHSGKGHGSMSNTRGGDHDAAGKKPDTSANVSEYAGEKIDDNH